MGLEFKATELKIANKKVFGIESPLLPALTEILNRGNADDINLYLLKSDLDINASMFLAANLFASFQKANRTEKIAALQQYLSFFSGLATASRGGRGRQAEGTLQQSEVISKIYDVFSFLNKDDILRFVSFIYNEFFDEKKYSGKDRYAAASFIFEFLNVVSFNTLSKLIGAGRRADSFNSFCLSIFQSFPLLGLYAIKLEAFDIDMTGFDAIINNNLNIDTIPKRKDEFGALLNGFYYVNTDTSVPPAIGLLKTDAHKVFTRVDAYYSAYLNYINTLPDQEKVDALVEIVDQLFNSSNYFGFDILDLSTSRAALLTQISGIFAALPANQRTEISQKISLTASLWAADLNGITF